MSDATVNVVINASPLIVLFKSELAELLPQLFDTIIVPQSVYDEVTSAKTDVAAAQLPNADWLQRIEVTVDPTIAAWDLGAGESAVLSYALANPGYRAMLDDAAARRCARSFKISTLGTGGALVFAKKRGLLESVDAPLQAIQDAGLWLSSDVVALLRRQADE